MKILFTGASSFTGMWFIQELAARGHQVTALIRKNEEEYEGLRRQRVEKVKSLCPVHFGITFGDEQFLNLIGSRTFDLFCHHAAEVNNYKSPDFEVAKALESNTFNLKKTLKILKEQECKRIVLTGSVFEPGEGEGSSAAVSPYGLSKGLTASYFEYYCSLFSIPLAKFVIPNPFGPFEEARFTHFLINEWKQGKTPVIQTPDYVRDNIHVSLLAKQYGSFIESKTNKCNPSGYVESMKAFTMRFSKKIEERLKFPCPFEIARQTQFLEPMVRHNTEPVDAVFHNWDEERAWDELADYYRSHL